MLDNIDRVQSGGIKVQSGGISEIKQANKQTMQKVKLQLSQAMSCNVAKNVNVCHKNG